MTDPVESLARTIAETAHDGQVDKAGQPYIGHVERVVARLTDPLDRAVAWLHDVVEDTSWTQQDLLRAGRDAVAIGDSRTLGAWHSVCTDVWALTHRKREPRADYYVRIVATSDRAVRVKLADIADNSDPERLALVERVMNERGEDGTATKVRLEAKYAKAGRALGVSAVPAPEGDDHQEGK